jgi:hypothetical protein
MDRPSTGSADFARRPSSPNGRNKAGDGGVKLLSYSNKFKSAKSSNDSLGGSAEKSGYINRFKQNQATNNYVVAEQRGPGTASSQCQKQKLRFPQFRRRSKSASRLEENLRASRSASTSQSNLLDLDESYINNNNQHKNSITSNRVNENNQENPQSNYSSQIQLVGFTQCNSEFSTANLPSNQRGRDRDSNRAGDSNSNHSNSSSAERTSNNSRFQTLKTSREVKMERERLRQEKLHRLTQVGFCLQQICLFIV